MTRRIQIRDVEDLKAEIRRRGLTMKGIAQRAKLSESAVRVAMKRPLPRPEEAVAEALGLPLHEAWPERYRPDGTRRPIRSPKPNQPQKRGHRQKGAAA
jgi:lambda repressor-like predicted transcriptional regulator